MDTLTEEIKESIRKNLPEQVGEALKVRLEDAEGMERKITELTDDLQDAEREVDTVKAQRGKAIEECGKLEALRLKAETVAESENRLKVTIAEIQRDAANERVEAVERIVSLVFKNPTIKKTAYENGTTPVQDNSGYVTQQSKSSSTDTTETTE